MPDLVTHTASAWFFLRFRCPKCRSIFYLGVILPDLLSRSLYILWPHLYGYTLAIHTPVMMFVVILWAGFLFDSQNRPMVRRWLFAGVSLHFFLDIFQRHLYGGYYWFFPFSGKTSTWGLFDTETSIRWIPVWLMILFSYEIWRKYK